MVTIFVVSLAFIRWTISDEPVINPIAGLTILGWPKHVTKGVRTESYLLSIP